MNGHGRYYRPVLKDSVDIQLQTAFNEGLWPSVIRLAAQRYKTKKDPYYEAIRISAESQVDTVTEKSAVVLAVDALVRDKTAALDIDSIELYEWALQDNYFLYDFSQTIGALRARWAKANPSSPAVIDCLEACVLAWDLVNAQQIAAILDRTQPGKHEGKTMFWNITLTHLLSTSPQCPESTAAMFGKLARMQLEKAATVTTSAADGKTASRGLREEEEINLYYRVVGKDAYQKSVNDGSSPISVLGQFDQGRKYLLLESLRVFEEAQDWQNVYKLCEYALNKKDENGNPSFVAFDMRTWKLFIKAATMEPDIEAALNNVTDILEKFVTTKTSVAPMYKKNIGLVTVELAFQNPSGLLAGVTGSNRASSRVITLYLILEQSLFQRSAFDDVKEYVGQLTFEEIEYFLDNFSRILLGKTSDEQRKHVVRVLEIKFRYLLTTLPLTLEHAVVVGETGEPQLKCRFCSSTTTKNCKTCLESVTSAALSAYKDLEKTPDALKGLDKDPRVDLALIAASALLKLSGLRQSRTPTKLPPLSDADMSRLLQASIIIGTQVQKTPNEIPLRLLLVQLYLLLGCASLAYQTWVPMDVKRTIQDSLSPLFFDRISTISPGLFQQTRRLMEPLTSYYGGCLREPSPVKIWDAFNAGSYISILDMAGHSDRLRRSCTLAMTVVEERRATRAYGGRIEGGIEQAPLLAHITDATTFVQSIDYGFFPNLEGTHSAPLHSLVQLGPELSSERCRLSLLAEQFSDAVAGKPPKEYKPVKANEVALKDRAYFEETFIRLHSSLAEILLHAPNTASKLSGAEHKFFTTILFLSALLRTALETPKSNPTPAGLSTAAAGIASALASLRGDLYAVPPRLAALEMGDVLHTLAGPHVLSLIREAALVAKQGAAFLLSFHAAEQARDRSGKAGLHKEALAQAKALDELAAKALAETREKVKTVKEALGLGGWLDRGEAWVFGADGGGDGLGELVRDVVGAAAGEEWISRLLESWREGVKGFEKVRWE